MFLTSVKILIEYLRVTTIRTDVKMSLRWSLSRYLLLWSAEHQEERLHRSTTEHVGVQLHASAARPITSHDEGQHVADQLVQQGTLQVPHQRLSPDKTR